MKLDNGEVFGAVQGLMQLSEKELPVKISYWLARLLNKLDGAYQAIEKVRNKLVQKHGTPNPKKNGQPELKVGDAKWEAFTVEFNELMIEKTEVDIEPVKLPIIIPEEVDGVKLTLKPNVILALKKFVQIEGLDLFDDDKPDLKVAESDDPA